MLGCVGVLWPLTGGPVLLVALAILVGPSAAPPVAGPPGAIYGVTAWDVIVALPTAAVTGIWFAPGMLLGAGAMSAALLARRQIAAAEGSRPGGRRQTLASVLAGLAIADCALATILFVVSRAPAAVAPSDWGVDDALVALPDANVRALVSGEALDSCVPADPAKVRAALRRHDATIAESYGHRRARLCRGRLRERQGDLEGALEDYGVAAARDPRSLTAAASLARVRLALGDPGQALDDLAGCVCVNAADPRAADAFRLLVEETGRLAEGAWHIRACTVWRPADAEWWAPILADWEARAARSGTPSAPGR